MNACNRCTTRRVTRSTNNKPTPLAKYNCSNCQQNLCEECKTSHKLRNKSHKVVKMKEFKSGKVDDERSSSNPEGGSWKFQYVFSTSGSVFKPLLPAKLAVNQDGDVAISDRAYFGVAVFTRRGKFKFLLEGVTSCSGTIAISSDNKYIVSGMNELLCYDRLGSQVLQIPTFDLDNKPTYPWSVAADKEGRVIAGLGHGISSIFTSDGRFVKNITTGCRESMVVAVTCKGELAIRPSYDPPKVMDFYGENVRYIQPPPDVNKWKPLCICCSHEYGEMFVSHIGSDGQPGGVYRYTPDGEYIGLVTDAVKKPTGLALTRDEQQLFVVEHDEGKIQVFQRP